jgi:hypothetical protein
VEALQETTKWKETTTQPNHIYLFDGSKAVAYLKFGAGQPFYFNKPLAIDRRGRTFVKADTELFSVKVKSTLIEVKGSKGNSYFIDPEAKTCSCPGFTFRGDCKHIKEIENA